MPRARQDRRLASLGQEAVQFDFGLTVTPVNDAPVAADNFASCLENGPGIIVPVLANDVDADGDALSVASVTAPANGSVLIMDMNGDGHSDAIWYLPNASFHGTDSFTYQASDGQSLSNVATVTINVTQTNHSPVPVDDSASCLENGPGIIVPVLFNDLDPNGDALSVTSVTAPAHGSVLIMDMNGDGLTDAVWYLPDPNFHGVDSFTYQASDGLLLSNVATVTINVEDTSSIPVPDPDEFTVEQGRTLTVAAPGVLANDADPDGRPLTAVLVQGPEHASEFHVDPDGSFIYQPAVGFVGVDHWFYVPQAEGDIGVPTEVTLVVSPALSTLSGQKYEDVNGNGRHDPGEPGLDGWRIELIEASTRMIAAATITQSVDRNGDGSINPETERGIYEFTNIRIGEYEIRELLAPAQNVLTRPAPRRVLPTTAHVLAISPNSLLVQYAVNGATILAYQEVPGGQMTLGEAVVTRGAALFSIALQPGMPGLMRASHPDADGVMSA